jgi:AraC family transcriptional regulator, regulatory protein of adaptative response / methylated-DNA-[protein]-cysteine methyltransferase
MFSSTILWKAPRQRAVGLAGVATPSDGPSIEVENVALVAKACRIIEESDEEPSLKDLADAIGRSPSYFHRLFRAATGLTPKDYAAGHHARKLRHGLASCSTLTDAIYNAGFNFSGRFYEKSTDILGMTPSRYRGGGVNEEIKFAVGQSFLVASHKRGVAAILLGIDPDELVRNFQDRFPKARLIGADREYEALVARVVGFVETPRIGLHLPLDIRGTVFQRRVWQGPSGDSRRRDSFLCRSRSTDRIADGGTGRCQRMRGE